MATEYKTCLKCGKMFKPQRSTRKFCSDACRVGYSKAGNQADADLRAIRDAALRLASFARKYPEMITDKQKQGLLNTGREVGRLLAIFDQALERAEANYKRPTGKFTSEE